MIQSFADQDTEELFHTESSRPFSALARAALRKLIRMNQARTLSAIAVPLSPSEILAEEYLNPMGISPEAMAETIAVSSWMIDEIIRGKRAIAPVLSVRFGAFFGHSGHFWPGIQLECDSRQAANVNVPDRPASLG
jgi:addiction module HigA family antidote